GSQVSPAGQLTPAQRGESWQLEATTPSATQASPALQTGPSAPPQWQLPSSGLHTLPIPQLTPTQRPETQSPSMQMASPSQRVSPHLQNPSDGSQARPSS